jgi:DNA-binding response OmpR family regulator
MKKVLIIEDDEFLRSLAAKRLGQENYTVVAAPSGDEGLKMAESEKPDLILLDLLLPGGLGGFEVLEQIRAKDKTLPIVVFSNLGERADIEKAQKLGATDFLVKANFTLDDVIGKVGGLLK